VFYVYSHHRPSPVEAPTLEDAAWEARSLASRGSPAAVVIRGEDERRGVKPVFAIWKDGRDYRESRTPKVGAQVLSYIRGRGGLP
jgi:hypothetical protein